MAKISCTRRRYVLLAVLLLAVVSLLWDAEILVPLGTSLDGNTESLWERWKEYRRENLFKIDTNGVVRIFPLNIHIKFSRAPGPHLHHNTYLRDYNKRKPQPPPFHNYTCAPHIPKHQRRVHTTFLDNWHLGTYWTRFQEGRGHLGGESYWVSGMDYILQHLGFEMVPALDFTAIQALQAGTSVAYVTNDGLNPSKTAYDHLKSVAHDESIICKSRILAWWNKPFLNGLDFFYGENQTRGIVQANRSVVLDKRQVLYPFPDPELVYPQPAQAIPFIVHGEVTLPPPTKAEAPREKRAFLLSKYCQGIPEVILTLLNAGFELHTTCFKGNLGFVPQNLTHQIVNHGFMKPRDYSLLMRSMAFILGVGQPTDSPTPYEGLYNGAAFLNPIFNLTRDGEQYGGFPTKDPNRTIQHIPLKSLGPPYIYNYDANLQDKKKMAQEVLKYAELAVQNRFVSYIPPEHRLVNVMKTVCEQLIEYNYNHCDGGGQLPKQSPLGLPARIYNRILGVAIRGYYMAAQMLLDNGFFN